MAYTMEYRRIHQLLDKYWECATSVEEERELRQFFTAGTIPPELLPYKAWFISHEAESLSPLGHDFDSRVLRQIEKEKRSYLRRRLLWGMAILLLLSMAAALIIYLEPSFFPF